MDSDPDNDVLFDAFLKQLQELDKFRITHIGRYTDSILERDDPDIRRLIEAMAMFTARTHLISERSIRRSHTRIFQQHFSYLLDPTPPMSLIQATSTPRFVDPKFIPVASSVELKGRPQGRAFSPRESGERTLHCQTLAPLELMPLYLDSVETYRRKDNGPELVLRFSADFSRLEPLETIHLHINCYNDFRSSATVHFHLQEHIEHAVVHFQATDSTGTPNEYPCEVTFQTPKVAEEEALLNRPLERSRSFFSFPQQKLFMNLVPSQTPKNWQKFTITLSLDDQWPSELSLTKDMFHLNVVPVANMTRALSNPISCDGTRERYRLRSKDNDDTHEIVSVEGVYKTNAKELIPLAPGVIEEDTDCYEIEHEVVETKRQSWVYLQVEDALEEPQNIVVDAWWYASIEDAERNDWSVQLSDRHIDGVRWSKCYAIVPAMKNASAEKMHTLMHLLSIKHKKTLSLSDLKEVLTVLGVEARGFLSKPFRAIQSLSVEPVPYSLSSAGMKYVYSIQLGAFAPEDLPLAYLLGAEILEILQVWNTEEVVELVMTIPTLERSFTYK